jgi:hypothetical protein
MTERGTSAGDGASPKTRYYLLTTDGGIVADQPGKMAGEAAIGAHGASTGCGEVLDHHHG